MHRCKAALCRPVVGSGHFDGTACVQWWRMDIVITTDHEGSVLGAPLTYSFRCLTPTISIIVSHHYTDLLQQYTNIQWDGFARSGVFGGFFPLSLEVNKKGSPCASSLQLPFLTWPTRWLRDGSGISLSISFLHCLKIYKLLRHAGSFPSTKVASKPNSIFANVWRLN